MSDRATDSHNFDGVEMLEKTLRRNPVKLHSRDNWCSPVEEMLEVQQGKNKRPKHQEYLYKHPAWA